MYDMRTHITDSVLKLILFMAALCTAGGVSADGARGPYQKLELFARALAHIEHAHVLDVDDDVLMYGAISGMLKALDPHSAFLDPEAYKMLRADAQGAYAGVGLEIDVRDGWLTVLTVFHGGPAWQAGLQRGDKFLTIDGRSARDMVIEEAVGLMRGEPGTVVAVAVRRPGRESALAVKLTRGTIDVPSVTSKLLRDGTAVVRLRMFQVDTGRALQATLQRIDDVLAAQDGKLRGLVLDLRDNPGGLVSAAVRVADTFLSGGVIVTTRGRGGRLQNTQRASTAGTRSVPLVVLVNQASASASEIVAGALQDRERAVVVGTKTFGKGSVQSVIELPGGSAMKLTTALYFTPNGRSIQARGIEPDVWVPQLSAAARKEQRSLEREVGEDQLDGHLHAPGTGAPHDELSAFEDDRQAMTAHQVLRALIAVAERSKTAAEE